VRSVARKQWSDLDREKALAVIKTGGSLSDAARAIGAAVSTVKGWLNKAPSKEVQEAREDAHKKFVRDAWESVSKAILVGNTMMSFVLENGDKLDEAFKAVAEADIDEEEKAQVLKTLASLTKINLKDLAIYAGTLYDKIALATGKPTGINRLEGQVTDTHEYKVTQEIVAKNPRLLDIIFAQDTGPDLEGRGG